MRVYISGPMTGHEDHNFPAFNDAAEVLRIAGFEVENPAEKGIIEEWSWEDYLRYDLAKLVECEAIHLLPGWRSSRGARLEAYVAGELGMHFLEIDPPNS